MKTAVSLVIALAMATTPALVAAQERGTVRLGYNRAWVSPALLIALTQGHFRQAGVGIAEKSFDNPADIVQAIAAGDLDAGVSPAGARNRPAPARGSRARAPTSPTPRPRKPRPGGRQRPVVLSPIIGS